MKANITFQFTNGETLSLKSVDQVASNMDLNYTYVEKSVPVDESSNMKRLYKVYTANVLYTVLETREGNESKILF